MEATRSDSPILPQELIAEVLCRLPVKSLCRFKSVSHSWYSLISDPHFAQTHFTQTTNKMPNRLILISDFYTLFSVDYSAQIPVATKLNFLPSVEDESYDAWSKILGSCNGLVLALNEFDVDKYLLNPSTRESKKIPESPFALDSVNAYNRCGLGYDSTTDDYKVVMLSHYGGGGGGVDEESGATTETNTIVSVYSLKSDSWRKIQGSSYLHCAADPPGVYLNGCVHWFAQRGSDYFPVIVAFDLGNETFREFLPPPFINNAVFLDEYNNAVSPWFYPAVLGGYLCLQAFTDVWVMKEYGKTESWTKFTIGKPDHISRIELMDLLEDGEFLFSRDEEQLVVYNSKDETSRDMVVCGIPGIFTSGGTYVESLISPARIHRIGRECEAWERMKRVTTEADRETDTDTDRPKNRSIEIQIQIDREIQIDPKTDRSTRYRSTATDRRDTDRPKQIDREGREGAKVRERSTNLIEREGRPSSWSCCSRSTEADRETPLLRGSCVRIRPRGTVIWHHQAMEATY